MMKTQKSILVKLRSITGRYRNTCGAGDGNQHMRGGDFLQNNEQAVMRRPGLAD